MWSSIKNLFGGSSSSDEEKCKDPQKCLEMLQLVVDNEADPEKAAQFLKKIEGCKMCTDCYEQDNCIKDILSSKVERKSVPQDVIDCIKLKLNEEKN